MMRSLAGLMMMGALALAGCGRSDEPAAPAAAPADPAARAAPITTIVAKAHTFQCGDVAVAVTFDGVGSVDLGFPGGPLTLPQVQAASGARFADGQGNEFWDKGDKATFTLAGQQARACTRAAEGS